MANNELSQESQKIISYLLENGKMNEIDSFLNKYKEDMNKDAFDTDKYECKTVYFCARYFDEKFGARYYYSNGGYKADVMGKDAVDRDNKCKELDGKLLSPEGLKAVNKKLERDTFFVDADGQQYSIRTNPVPKIILKVVTRDKEFLSSGIYNDTFITEDGDELTQIKDILLPKLYPYRVGTGAVIDNVPVGHITSNDNLRTSSNSLECIAGKYKCGAKLNWARHLSSEEIYKLIDNYNLYDYATNALLIPNDLKLFDYSYSDLINVSGELLSRVYLEPRELMQTTLCLLHTETVASKSSRNTATGLSNEEKLRMKRLQELYNWVLGDKALYLAAKCWDRLDSNDLAAFINLNAFVLLPFIKQDLADMNDLQVRIGYLKEKYKWSGVDLGYDDILAGYKYMGNLDFTMNRYIIEAKLQKENIAIDDFRQGCMGPDDVRPTFPAIKYTDEFGYTLNDLGNKFEKVENKSTNANNTEAMTSF